MLTKIARERLDQKLDESMAVVREEAQKRLDASPETPGANPQTSGLIENVIVWNNRGSYVYAGPIGCN